MPSVDGVQNTDCVWAQNGATKPTTTFCCIDSKIKHHWSYPSRSRRNAAIAEPIRIPCLLLAEKVLGSNPNLPLSLICYFSLSIITMGSIMQSRGRDMYLHLHNWLNLHTVQLKVGYLYINIIYLYTHWWCASCSRRHWLTSMWSAWDAMGGFGATHTTPPLLRSLH